MLCAIVRTSISVGVDEPHCHQVRLGVKVSPVRDCERLVCDRVLDRTPNINDADATLEQAVSVGAEMTVYAGDASIVGLVDVDTFNRSTNNPSGRRGGAGLATGNDHSPSVYVSRYRQCATHRTV